NESSSSRRLTSSNGLITNPSATSRPATRFDTHNGPIRILTSAVALLAGRARRGEDRAAWAAAQLPRCDAEGADPPMDSGTNPPRMRRVLSMLERMRCLLKEEDWPSNRAEFLDLEAEVRRLLAPSP